MSTATAATHRSPGKRALTDAALIRLLTSPFDTRHPAAAETLALLFLCSIDMYTTVYWVKTGVATEANPLLAWTFALHPLVFVAMKFAMYVPAIILAALLARVHPRFVTGALRVVLIAYVAIYLLGVVSAR